MYLTNAEFVSHAGTRCPACVSEDIRTTDNVQIDDGSAWQDVECIDCHAEWQDVYSLVGYDNLDFENQLAEDEAS